VYIDKKVASVHSFTIYSYGRPKASFLANDDDEKQTQEKYFKDNILFKELGQSVATIATVGLVDLE